nr:DUF6884 domain-containing protein [Nocardiopsis mwathae]
MPPSAYKHAAFWKGARPQWPGFTTENVRVGRSVTFVRRSASPARTRQRAVDGAPPPQPANTASTASTGSTVGPDFVLVGCGKKKLNRPAPAKDLYTSALFAKQRSYAEATGRPWFILSAEHGLVPPQSVLHPYELHLATTSPGYRRTWGMRVVGQLKETAGPLAGRIIEVHAGSAYTDAIRDRLSDANAKVLEPLHGLPIGKRLAWYNPGKAASASAVEPIAPIPEAASLVERLGTFANTVAPLDFLRSGGAGLRLPGLYSWWVDQDGAADLSAGLRLPLAPGVIYAGLAGATRSRSGRKSENTLWGRIRGMHLGGRHEFSTFRLSLGSILANARAEPKIDEQRLTSWMQRHLRLIAIPIEDADALDGLETAVLAQLNPPLNLAKMPRTPVRRQLTELRRHYGRRTQ